MPLIRWITKGSCEVACDNCNKPFTIIRARFNSRPFHYCSNPCRNAQQRKGGKVHERFKGVIKAKYGVENPMQVQSVKERSISTRMNYHENVKAERRSKARRKSLAKIGYEHHWKSPDVQAKQRKTQVERYGVEHSMQSSLIKNKAIATCIENHGVKYGVVTSQCREKTTSKETLLKKHETRKRNGTYQTSYAESRCYDALCALFSRVERQAIINEWFIDFYVHDINTYVQYDGTYWHGHDRPIEVIQLHEGVNDRGIERTYFRDIEQNEWFETNGKKLVRIHEKDFIEWEKSKTVLSNLQMMLISLKS